MPATRRISALALTVFLHGAAGICLAQSDGAPAADAVQQPNTLLQAARTLFDRTPEDYSLPPTSHVSGESDPQVVAAAHAADGQPYT